MTKFIITGGKRSQEVLDCLAAVRGEKYALLVLTMAAVACHQERSVLLPVVTELGRLFEVTAADANALSQAMVEDYIETMKDGL